jgi:MoxR-like ATPase
VRSRRASSLATARRTACRSHYICTRELATAVYLAFNLQKPILVEGPAGVGKTELAKSMATISTCR